MRGIASSRDDPRSLPESPCVHRSPRAVVYGTTLVRPSRRRSFAAASPRQALLADRPAAGGAAAPPDRHDVPRDGDDVLAGAGGARDEGPGMSRFHSWVKSRRTT